MVKLFLFRAISLLSLFGLLLWESLNGGYQEDFLDTGAMDKDFQSVNSLGREFTKDDNPVQAKRKKSLMEYCRDRDPQSILPRGTTKFEISSYTFRNIIVNDKHSLLYCYIPKVACSNWKRVLMVLNGNAADPYQINTADVHNRSLGYFRYLNEYEPEEIVYRLSTYYKFLFVRHPFERLVSAYRNKFIESYNLTLFKKLYGRQIIKHFRQNPDAKSLKTGEGVSFSEFVDYLLISDPEYMDRHWKQFDLLCHPCLVYYDYVGHFENLIPEANDLLQTLQVDDLTPFPGNITSKYKQASSDLAKKYFKQLSKKQIEGLKTLYRHDFNMFGYSSDDYL